MTRVPPALFIAILFAAVLFRALSQPPRLHGDGLEYIIQTQAIVFDRTLAVDTGKRAAYWNATNPFSFTLGEAKPPGNLHGEESQASAGFGGLYPDSGGGYHYLHFWFYSLICAPLYLLLHVLDPRLEYTAFPIMNAILFALPFLVELLRRRNYEPAVAFSIFILSPLTGYVWWHSPEILCFSFCVLSLLLTDSPKFNPIAPLLLAPAIAHYPPAGALLPLLWMLSANDGWHRRRLFIAANAIALAAVAASFLWYWYWFGAFNLAHKLGFASREYMSAARAVDFFINPFIGALWGFAAPFLYGIFRGAYRTRIFWICLGFSLAVACLCSSTNNFNSAAFGCARYAAWFCSPIFYAIMVAPLNISDSRYRAVLLILALFPVMVAFRLYAIIIGNPAVFEVALKPTAAVLTQIAKYPGGPETFAEQISGNDFQAPFQFSGVYVWNLPWNMSAWLVSKRAMRTLRTIQVKAIDDCPARLPNPFHCANGVLDLDLSKIEPWNHTPSLGHYRYLWVDSRVSAGTVPGLFIR